MPATLTRRCISKLLVQLRCSQALARHSPCCVPTALLSTVSGSVCAGACTLQATPLPLGLLELRWWVGTHHLNSTAPPLPACAGNPNSFLPTGPPANYMIRLNGSDPQCLLEPGAPVTQRPRCMTFATSVVAQQQAAAGLQAAGFARTLTCGAEYKAVYDGLTGYEQVSAAVRHTSTRAPPAAAAPMHTRSLMCRVLQVGDWCNSAKTLAGLSGQNQSQQAGPQADPGSECPVPLLPQGCLAQSLRRSSPEQPGAFAVCAWRWSAVASAAANAGQQGGSMNVIIIGVAVAAGLVLLVAGLQLCRCWGSEDQASEDQVADKGSEASISMVGGRGYADARANTCIGVRTTHPMQSTAPAPPSKRLSQSQLRTRNCAPHPTATSTSTSNAGCGRHAWSPYCNEP
jgi:hypothetical protein